MMSYIEPASTFPLIALLLWLYRRQATALGLRRESLGLTVHSLQKVYF